MTYKHSFLNTSTESADCAPRWIGDRLMILKFGKFTRCYYWSPDMQEIRFPLYASSPGTCKGTGSHQIQIRPTTCPCTCLHENYKKYNHECIHTRPRTIEYLHKIKLKLQLNFGTFKLKLHNFKLKLSHEQHKLSCAAFKPNRHLFVLVFWHSDSALSFAFQFCQVHSFAHTVCHDCSDRHGEWYYDTVFLLKQV